MGGGILLGRDVAGATLRGDLLAAEGGGLSAQGGVGREDPVVAVAVDVGWGHEECEAFEEFEGREPEDGGTLRGRTREVVEDVIGAAGAGAAAGGALEALLTEGRTGAVAEESFEARAVPGFDAYGGIDAEPSVALPGRHVVGDVGLEEAVAAEVAKDPAADGGGEVTRLLRRDGGVCLEEAHSAVRIALKEAVADDDVVMEVGVQGSAEAVQEGDGAGLRLRVRAGTAGP